MEPVFVLIGSTAGAADYIVHFAARQERSDSADQAAHTGLVGEGERLDAAVHTDLASKTRNLGLAHHNDSVADVEKTGWSARTDHVVVVKGKTGSAARMDLVGQGVAVVGSTVHTDSVVQRRMADSVVHSDLAC